MSITEFLLARIVWDEATLERSTTDARNDGSDPGQWAWVRRERAECQAKRAIIEYHRAIDMAITDYGADQVAEGTGQFQECLEDGGTYPCPTLRHLAAVYADHPDYRQEWRP